jgi:hypothetical protein
MPGFIRLNDPASHRQLLIRPEHVTTAEIRREDGIVILHLLTGGEVSLTQEESHQFLRHAHPAGRATRARAKARGGPRRVRSGGT